MNLERLLTGSTVVGIVLILAVLALAWANRVFLRDIAHDPEPAWRGLARIAGGLTTAMLLWIAVFDQWRQLIDEPLRRAGRFPSERVVLDPVPEPVRTMSLVLLTASLLATAPLIARHVGGYAIQIIASIGALALCIPLYTIRVRFDLGLAFGFGGDIRSLGDILGYLIYLIMTWALLIAVILLAYTALAFATAVPVTLLLDIAGRREPRTTSEAESFFASIRDRIASSDDN